MLPFSALFLGAGIGMAPSDPRVELIEVPGLLMAALSYSGVSKRLLRKMPMYCYM